jgi:cob(I)alamin adenosyltransferase
MVEKKKTIKDQEKRSLVKTEDGRYKLELTNEATNYHMTQIFDKGKMKEIYEELKPQYDGLMRQIGQAKKELKAIEVKETPELMKFKEMLTDLQKLAQKEKLETNLEAMNKDIVRLEKETKEIEFVIPELKRN